MFETRRHRLIWVAVGGTHLAALGALWLGGSFGASEPAHEGGLVIVNLVSDPIALPGESKGGVALGAGLSVAATARVASVAPVVAAPAPQPKSIAEAPPAFAPAPVVSKGDVPAVIAAPAVEVFVPPSFRFRQEPSYPDRARRVGSQGVVGVRLRLGADGVVRSVELKQSSGSRLLDEAALEAARGSTFVPASRDGLPIEADADASYRFELR